MKLFCSRCVVTNLLQPSISLHTLMISLLFLFLSTSPPSQHPPLLLLPTIAHPFCLFFFHSWESRVKNVGKWPAEGKGRVWKLEEARLLFNAIVGGLSSSFSETGGTVKVVWRQCTWGPAVAVGWGGRVAGLTAWAGACSTIYCSCCPMPLLFSTSSLV